MIVRLRGCVRWLRLGLLLVRRVLHLAALRRKLLRSHLLLPLAWCGRGRPSHVTGVLRDSAQPAHVFLDPRLVSVSNLLLELLSESLLSLLLL